jgi:hypothetical protein
MTNNNHEDRRDPSEDLDDLFKRMIAEYGSELGTQKAKELLSKSLKPVVSHEEAAKLVKNGHANGKGAEVVNFIAFKNNKPHTPEEFAVGSIGRSAKASTAALLPSGMINACLSL